MVFNCRLEWETRSTAENGLLRTSSVVYLTIDDLIGPKGDFIAGLDEFFASLDHAGIPCVWLTSQTRLQIDEPRRKMSHSHPFIAEDGCGVFLPEDYFHLKPRASARGRASTATIRLGRFTCLPVAAQQPAASDCLEALAAETQASVVPLQSLSPRELAQNTGLPPRQAEFARQRDFDELFFFAGAIPDQIEGFQQAAHKRDAQLRPRGTLWSLALGPSLSRCIRELSKLYDRASHAHLRTVGIASPVNAKNVFAICDRGILLSDNGEAEQDRGGKVMEVPLRSAHKWDRLIDYLSGQA